MSINNIYKFKLPEAHCWCLQTCNFVLVSFYHGIHCYRIQHEQVMGINNINKFTLPDTVYCCLQTFTF